MSAIEPPSLWPTRIGSAASSWGRSSGSTSSASSWKKAGVRGSAGGSERPWPKREKAITRRPEAAPQPDRAEPLVEEDERPPRRVAGVLGGLDAQAADGGGARDGGGRG